VKPELIRPSDYEYYGEALIRSAKDSTKGFENLRKAIQLDTAAVSSARTELAKVLFSSKKYKDAAVEYDFIATKNTKQNPTDYFNLGKAHYFGKDYVKADTAFGAVIRLAPTFASGYLWRGRSASKLDPESTKGTAVPHYSKFITEAEKDKEKFKKDLIEAYSYFVFFHYVKKEVAKSDEFWNKVLAIDPANATAKNGLNINKDGGKAPAKPKGK
jgi:tetratricopeptide (TPR) repeat protein